MGRRGWEGVLENGHESKNVALGMGVLVRAS